MPCPNRELLTEKFNVCDKVPRSVELGAGGPMIHLMVSIMNGENVETYGVDFPAPRWSKRMICTNINTEMC